MNAQHQNMWGTTHTIVANTHLIHLLRLAGRNNDLKDTVGTAQLLRDTFDREEPCPAIAIGDDIHFRTILIDSKTKSISLVDPFGSNFSENVKVGMLDFYGKDNTGDWSFTEWKIKLQHDSYSCGIWAIWMQETWMQYWMQQQHDVSFETWFEQDVQSIPTATCLREHYHIQMANAMVVTQLAGQHTIRARPEQTNTPIMKTHPLRWQSTTLAACKIHYKLHRTENKACKVATRQKQQTKHNTTHTNQSKVKKTKAAASKMKSTAEDNAKHAEHAQDQPQSKKRAVRDKQANTLNTSENKQYKPEYTDLQTARCDALTVLTHNIMGTTTMLSEVAVTAGNKHSIYRN